MNHEEISKYSELIDFILERFDKAQIDLNTKENEVIIIIKKMSA